MISFGNGTLLNLEPCQVNAITVRFANCISSNDSSRYVSNGKAVIQEISSETSAKGTMRSLLQNDIFLKGDLGLEYVPIVM